MKIVTVATDNQRYFPYLVESCRRNDCELVVLGWGQKWQGYAWKFKLVMDYLGKISPDEIICFVDAYDVIILQHRDKIVKEFLNIVGSDKSKVVFSVEQNNNMLASMMNKVVFLSCKNIYLNTGTYIGYSKTIKSLLDQTELIKQDISENDQFIMQKLCSMKQNKPIMNEFMFDTKNRIFIVIPSFYNKINRQQEHIEIESNILVYKQSTYPCILHAPANANIDDIVTDLGYASTLYSSKSETSYKQITSNLKHYIFWFYKYNWYIIIILILLIFIFLLIVFIITQRSICVLSKS